MSLHGFKICEEKVRKVLEEVALEAMEEALVVEKEKSEKYSTLEDGILPSLTLSVDMGWNKRSSGRRYDSPSGVFLAMGGERKKS